MTIASLMTLTFMQGHKCISNLFSFFNSQYLGQCLWYYIETWHDGRHQFYMHSLEVELDLDMFVRLVLLVLLVLEVISQTVFKLWHSNLA